MVSDRKRAMLFCGNVEMFIPIIETLQNSNLVEPVFWAARKQHSAKIKRKFKSVACFDSLCDGVYVEGLSKLGVVLDYSRITRNLINNLAPYERVFMEMLYTRADPGGGFSYYESQKVYRDHLVQAFSLLDKFKPDVLIMESAPHLIWDYALYIVATTHYKLNIIILSDTPIPNRMVVYRDLKQCSVSNAKSTSTGFKKEKCLPKDIVKYIESIRSDFLSGASYMLKALMPAEAKLSHWSIANINKRLNQQKCETKKRLWQERRNQIFNTESDISDRHYLKQSGKSWKDSFRGGRDFYTQRLVDIKKRKALLNRYESLSKIPDLRQPYIYFPLHWQPENTTVPLAGMFSDQYFILSLLIEAIPTDWKIYVKENPNQFEWHRGSFARYPRYYDDMLGLGRVELVRMEFDSFQLIDNSCCVCAITGTSGWEAVVRGKSALVAGSCVWYADAPRVHHISSISDIKNAINEIRNQDSVLDENSLTEFLTDFLNKSYKCTVSASHVKTSVSDMSENVKAITQAITDNL